MSPANIDALGIQPDEVQAVADALAKHRAAELKKRLALEEKKRKEADAALVAAAKQGERQAVIDYWRKLRSANHPDKAGSDAVLVIYTAACRRLDALMGRGSP